MSTDTLDKIQPYIDEYCKAKLKRLSISKEDFPNTSLLSEEKKDILVLSQIKMVNYESEIMRIIFEEHTK